MEAQIVQFEDDIAEDEPIKYYRAWQESNGRWRVEGAERWRYESSELVFHAELPAGVWRDDEMQCWRLRGDSRRTKGVWTCQAVEQ